MAGFVSSYIELVYQMPRIPSIEDLTTSALGNGLNILIEYDPATRWIDATLTTATGWLEDGGTNPRMIIAKLYKKNESLRTMNVRCATIDFYFD
jgi:hypothetical protein